MPDVDPMALIASLQEQNANLAKRADVLTNEIKSSRAEEQRQREERYKSDDRARVSDKRNAELTAQCASFEAKCKSMESELAILKRDTELVIKVARAEAAGGAVERVNTLLLNAMSSAMGNLAAGKKGKTNSGVFQTF